jgi:SnoaL-like domain
MRLLPALLLLTSCGPVVMKGNADLRLRELLHASPVKADAIAALLTPDAQVHREEGTVQGAAAGASALAGVQVDATTPLYRHHDVSLLVLGDGRVLFLQRDREDRVSRAVELRPPSPADGMPSQAVYYDRSWNADEARAREALLRAIWAEDGRYVDPMADVAGPEGVSKMIGNFRFVFTGAQVKSTSGVAEGGNGWVTFDWVIISRLGRRVLFKGFDVAHLNADGKIELLAGFFGSRYPQ